ncbi:MAG: PIG-L family deacetylase [Chloroflexi bacterium]|nr:PIG-L family deacetylase [Chloroflexota bacterium]
MSENTEEAHKLQPDRRRGLLACLAHPDDETFGCGGSLARCAAEGIQVHLVCATLGEVGEISDPSLASRETLPQVREEELRCACRALGIAELHLLWVTGIRGWQAMQPMSTKGRYARPTRGRLWADWYRLSAACAQRWWLPSTPTAAMDIQITSPSTASPQKPFTPLETPNCIPNILSLTGPLAALLLDHPPESCAGYAAVCGEPGDSCGLWGYPSSRHRNPRRGDHHRGGACWLCRNQAAGYGMPPHTDGACLSLQPTSPRGPGAVLGPEVLRPCLPCLAAGLTSRGVALPIVD